VARGQRRGQTDNRSGFKTKTKRKNKKEKEGEGEEAELFPPPWATLTEKVSH
jgi:hypothetical protein